LLGSGQGADHASFWVRSRPSRTGAKPAPLRARYVSLMTSAGLAHVAALSFLAARAAPSGAFWLALAGGAALAREADTRGVRAGYAASVAAMLQTVAIVGPVRFSAPLTQAMSAPLLGAMHARGRRPAELFVACLVIRLVNYAVLTAFAVFVLLGPKGYAGSYNALLGWAPLLPHGLAGALILTVIIDLAFGGFFSAVQVWLYRRALTDWSTRPLGDAPQRATAPPATAQRGGADPRAVLAAATLMTVVLLVSHSWSVLAAVTVWLTAASTLVRDPDRDVLRVGLLLAAVLAGGTLAASLFGGLGAEESASRAVRGALLVLVATWLRMAAGSAGLREAFRRTLLRMRRVPSAHEAAQILTQLDSDHLLAGSTRALRDRLRGVRSHPVSIADAVLAWAAHEAHALPVGEPTLVTELRFRARDAALAASLLLTAGSLAAVLA
jgi:hypothetical protein